VKGKEYICLEPWTGPRNALNTGEKLIYIEPDQSCSAVVEMVYSPLSV
jgi:galactose mutarotase-like enzyme